MLSAPLLMGASPATGETVKVLPWVFGGIGLVAVIALIVLTVLDAKKKQASQTGGTPPAANTPEGQEPPADTPHDDEP
mgnify:CR=1 FL=1